MAKKNDFWDMIRAFRSMCYAISRFLGDLQAASKGPGALLKRYARKTAYKKTGRSINKVLR